VIDSLKEYQAGHQLTVAVRGHLTLPSSPARCINRPSRS
jgi:hypothetical protein